MDTRCSRRRRTPRSAVWSATHGSCGRSIPGARTRPLERRLAAARLCGTTPSPGSKLALLGCARDGEPRMRAVALAALAGWNDDAVHAQFLDELERAFAGDPTARGALAERHFEE